MGARNFWRGVLFAVVVLGVSFGLGWLIGFAIGVAINR